MSENELKHLLSEVRSGAVSTDDALGRLKSGPFKQSNLGHTKVDHHRRLRLGLAEVIYGESKTTEQILDILEAAAGDGAPILTTRLNAEKLAALRSRFPTGRHNTAARTFLLNAPAPRAADLQSPHVAVVAAGTSDLPVAEEAAEVCVAMGVDVAKYYDVGVAGIHRVLAHVGELQAATSLIVVAGMEGALPSVVAGLVSRPVIAVPTSVGYGASFGGISALLGMLNSCAPGLSVVNIDNGFSAGYAASQVVRLVIAASQK